MNTQSIICAVKVSSLRQNCIKSIKIKNQYLANAIWAPKVTRFINKVLYRIGFGAVLNRYDSSLTIYSSREDRNMYASYAPQSIFCNFGSGAFQHPKWLSFDYPGQSKYYKALKGEPGKNFSPIDLCTSNLRLPFEDNSVELIYCSHTLEHLEEDKAIHFLTECHRILKHNGVFRLVVPDISRLFYFSRLISNQPIEDQIKKSVILSTAFYGFHPSRVLSDEIVIKAMSDSNYHHETFIMRVKEMGISDKFDGNNPESHISFWDYEKLKKYGVNIGYKCCLPFNMGSSTAAPFKNIEIFDSSEPQLSIYVELIK